MGQQSPVLVPLLIGIVIGVAAASFTAWRILRSRIEAARRETRNEGQIEIARLSERLSRSSETEIKLAECASRLQEETNRVATLTEQNARLPELQQLLGSATSEVQRLSQDAADLRTKLGVSEAKEDLPREFESLANRVLEDTSKRFTEQNQTNLGHLLGPLATKLQEFQRKVEEVYDKEGKDRTALATQVNHLMGLNQQLSQDAHNLTQALKGSGKTQGHWGELILERVLEASGLRQGQEYELRETYKREDGSRAQPDVVIHLPEDKHIVVDAKVSLTAYADYASADSDSDREAAIALHLDSVRRHVKELSEKNYHALYDLKSLDFVIMFIPVEPAFMLAISQDGNLCESAWKKNVLLVSPTTFLFVVRTVAYLWRQEQATRSVQEIAQRGAEFYDKLVGFVEDLAGVGNRLRQAGESYDNARNKLVQGRGNLIRQAEMLKDLGVKPSKALPEKLVDSALTEQPLVLPTLAAVSEVEDFERGTTCQ
jgi:DNA recombination protein RmuC